jgi:protein TonB
MSRVLTANESFKIRSNHVLEAGLVAGTILHLLAFALVPPGPAPDRIALSPLEPTVDYVIPEEIEILPPPPEPRRPTLPAPGSIASLAEPVPEVILPSESNPFPGPEVESMLSGGTEGNLTAPVPPVLLHRVVPTYPPLAREAGAEGTVRIQVLVDGSGRVTQATVLDADTVESLKRAAREAAFGHLFTPARQNGRPVAVKVILTFVFSLR